MNVSPKGIGGTFVVVDEHTVAYLDVTASGAETIAHLRQPGNGRITLMFCSFDRTPDVVRLHGTGRVVSIHDEEYGAWADRFTETRGARGGDRRRRRAGLGLVRLRRPADGARRGSGTCCPTHMERKGDRRIAGLPPAQEPRQHRRAARVRRRRTRHDPTTPS